MWRGAGAVVGGSAPSEMEFWKQADAAQALHKDLVRKYRLRQVQGESNCNQCFFCLVKFECGRILRRHFFWHFFFGDLWPKTGLKDLNWNNKKLHQPWQQRKVQSSGDKASEIWTAYGSLEELLEGMEQRYLELCQANDTEDEPLGERTNIKCLGQKRWGGMRWVRFEVYNCFW